MRSLRAEEPIEAPNLADEIAFRLECDILDGRIGLGERLAQDDLCARFGVSRTPIREALMKLHTVNLVSLRPNRGAIVRVPGRVEVKEAYELRSELEGFAAELAVTRGGTAALRALDRAQEDLAAVIRGIDPHALADSAQSSFNRNAAAANDAFHDVILAAAGNRALAEAVSRLRGFFPKDYVWRALGSVDELLTMNIEQHEEIASAIRAGEARLARDAMQDHVSRAGRVLVEHLDRNRFWG